MMPIDAKEHQCNSELKGNRCSEPLSRPGASALFHLRLGQTQQRLKEWQSNGGLDGNVTWKQAVEFPPQEVHTKLVVALQESRKVSICCSVLYCFLTSSADSAVHLLR